MAIIHSLSMTTPDNPAYEAKPSDWNNGHVQAITIEGNTAGASTISGTNIVFSAGPNATISVNNGTLVWSGGAGAAGNTGYLSDSVGTKSMGTIVLSNSNGFAWGLNGQTLTASYTVPTQSNQSEGFYAVGNTTQNSSTTLDARTVSFGGRGDITVGYSNGTIQISGNQSAQTGISGLQVSNTTYTSGTVTFQNANGISFGSSGANGVSASYTVPTVPAQLSVGDSNVGNTAGDTGVFTGRVIFAGGNNITLSGSSNGGSATITISGANAGGAQTGISGIVVSDATYTSGTVSFSNQNGVTIGSSVNGATQYIRLSVASQTNQSEGFYAVGNTTQNSSTTLDARTVSFGGRGDITVGYSNGTIQISGNQTNQSMGLYGLSQTTGQSSSSTVDARSLSVNAYGIISVGMSAGSLLISSPDSTSFAQLSVGNSNLGNTAGDTGVVTGRLVLVGTNGITLSGSTNAGSMTISVSGGAAAGLAAVYDGANSISSGTIRFTNANGVSFSINGQTVSGSVAAQTNQSAGWYGVGNTTQNSSTTLDARTFSLGGRGDISVGYSNGTIQLSVSQTAQTQSNVQGIIVSNTTYRTGDVSFSNLNGISFGSNGANVVTASYTVPTVPAQLSVGDSNIGNTAGDTGVFTGRVVFAGGNNITLSGSSNGGSATITISGAAAGGAQTAISGIVVSDTTYTSGTVSFSNQNGVTIGSSVNGATQYIRLSVAAQTNQSLGIYNSSQTTGGSSSSTYDARSLSIVYSGNISGGWTNSSLLLNVTTAAQTNQSVGLYALGNTTQNSSTTLDARTMSFNALGAMTWGYSNGSIQVSAPPTSSLVGTSGISISTAGSTISIGMEMGSFYGNVEGEWPNSTTMQMLQSTSHVQPFVLNNPVSFAVIRIPMSLSCGASTTAATTGNSQFSYGHTRSHNFVLYSRGVGASSLSLQSIASTQLTDQQSGNVSANANSTQFSYTNRATFQMSTGTVGYTYDYSSSAASLNFHTSNMTAATGLKIMEFAWATSLKPGQYWLAYGVSSSTTTQFNAAGTKWWDIASIYGLSQPNLAFGTIGDATNNSVGPYFGAGSFTTAGGGTTASIPISAITTSGSHNKMFFQIFRIA